MDFVAIATQRFKPLSSLGSSRGAPRYLGAMNHDSAAKEMEQLRRTLGLKSDPNRSDEDTMNEMMKKLELGDVDVDQMFAGRRVKKDARRENCKERARQVPQVATPPFWSREGSWVSSVRSLDARHGGCCTIVRHARHACPEDWMCGGCCMPCTAGCVR